MAERDETRQGHFGPGWLLRGLAAIGLSVFAIAPLHAQDAASSDGYQLRFWQFQSQASPPQTGQVQRSYPFGVYRADNLNSSGPEYYGWSYLSPNQPWRDRATNIPSRQRYGLGSGENDEKQEPAE